MAVLRRRRFAFASATLPGPSTSSPAGGVKGRGARMDEMIAIIRVSLDRPRRAFRSACERAGGRALPRGDFFEYHGAFYDVPSFKLCPVAAAPIPILIGGHADAALRRAARLGDGWMHAGGGQAADLDRRARAARRAAPRARREREPLRST